ncbi:MAG: hypothetical protein FWD42_10280, partial [Solirubrobacterales bacterium]|nr:hypothetical protein [Solirubrobacterales bacterium]
TKMFAGHPVSTKPHAGGILLLGKNRKFAAAAIPTVADTLRVGGKTANDLEPLCPANTANLGTWCLEKQPYPVSKEEAGKANYFWVNQKCAELGGFLPSASELVGAAKLVDLEGGPGLGGKREMSATLITTAAGSDAAGSEGVSEGSLGNPRAGEPNPVPVPAVPEPQTAQYVTVFSDNQHGGLAGGEPVSTPQNFRCGFYKMPAGAAKGG